MCRKALIKIYVFIFILIIITLLVFNSSDKSADIDYSFPDGFLIGAASSSYQVEGAWNTSGKSESVWDNFVHTRPEKIADRSTGDIACDSYHKYKEDIQLMKDIGINHYRFSLSWARILPTGYSKDVNKEGLRYYHNILDELEKHKIEPMVTIYHWDHPQSLERLGGWMNELMADFFADYATVVFREFGHRVKMFTTINEPYIYCIVGYKTLRFAPGLNLSGWGAYQCVHNMLKAHAIAYHIYDREFRSQQNGKIGIIMPCFQHYSKDKNDLVSTNIAFEFQCGWTAHPIFSKDGDYPKIMKQMIAKNSKLEGRKRSKLPTFSKQWIEYIKGTSDYFGLNHYTADLVEPSPEAAAFDSLNDDGLLYTVDEKWLSSQSKWLKVVPDGLGEILRQIKNRYNNPPVYIMENGVSDPNTVNDTIRIQYLYAYMKEMLVAMKRDNCNIKAYTIWSFLDSFEWDMGYVDHFGLISVDFNDPNRKRTPKKSVSWLKSVLKSRKLMPIIDYT
ncbi:myrosinase 1-like [Nasonia vitripennis]|uniref:beta-glucosidase n=1 Tax=Nasonia vitripennis TaxID=7425 RepID=A0A7M7IVC0_NASVI|nr:myrosinase 1-like [Nasonia vitripennis]